MASDVQVASLALGLVGDDPINSLDPPDNEPRAKAVAAWFPVIRDGLLRRHNWNFANRRSNSLAADAVAPLWGRDLRYPKPNDCIRVLEVNGENRTTHLWRVEENWIHTNLPAPLEILYTARITDAEAWDALFVKAMTHALAAVLAQQLREDSALAREQSAFATTAINDAKSFDGQEQTDTDTSDYNQFGWLIARLGSGSTL